MIENAFHHGTSGPPLLAAEPAPPHRMRNAGDAVGHMRNMRHMRHMNVRHVHMPAEMSHPTQQRDQRSASAPQENRPDKKLPRSSPCPHFPAAPFRRLLIPDLCSLTLDL